MEKQEESTETPSGHMNLENDYELEYWTTQLKVTNYELREAVAEVGDSIAAVKVYLNKA